MKEEEMEIETPMQYPIGDGLSYTKFELSEPTVEIEGRKVKLTIDVVNIGDIKGRQTVQVYVQDMVASSARPNKELKGFEQVELDPGASKSITILLKETAFSFYTHDGDFVFEPGDFKIMTGSSSNQLQEKIINLK